METATTLAPPLAALEQPPLNASEEQVFNLLSAGLNAVTVASTLGLSEGYISQLLSNPEFRDRVMAERLKKAKGGIERDSLRDTVEDKILNRLNVMVGFVKTPMEAARIYQIVNNAKRATEPLTGQGTASAPTVVLNLPKSSHVSFTLAHDTQQVVEVDGRSMAPMSAAKLKEMMSAEGSLRVSRDRLTQVARLTASDLGTGHV